jgi:hypothetical protein
VQQLIEWLLNYPPHPMAATDNHQCRHVQVFTRKRLHMLFARCSLTVVEEHGSTLCSGPFIAHTLSRSEAFIRWNARVTNHLPLVLASGWYFVLERASIPRAR